MTSRKPKTFQLSSKGLANIANSSYRSNFKFLVGKNAPYAEYFVNSFLATFISPKVASLYCVDPSIDSFIVPIEDKSCSFQLVIDIINGKNIEPTDIQCIFLREVAKIFGNNELYNKFANISQLKTTNAIPQMEEKYKNNMDVNAEIDLLAENVSSFTAKDFLDIPIDLLERIFASPKLLVQDEDTFCNFLIEIVEAKGKEATHLFSFIVFENLSNEALKKVTDYIKVENIDTLLWSVIKRRLVSNVKRVVECGDRYSKVITLCGFGGEMFQGIFYMLKKEHSGNPVDKGIVGVKAVGQSGQNKPKGLFDMNRQYNWGMENKAGNYLQMDFKDSRVSVSGYSIKSYNGSHWDRPQSWVIEGSNDEQEWTIIDDKVDNKEMGGNERQHLWEVTKSNEFRYIRWRIQKDNQSGPLLSSQFELFGEYIKYLNEKDHINSEDEDFYDDDSSVFSFTSPEQ